MKEKWYLTTGSESEEIREKAYKIIFSNGMVKPNSVTWSWSERMIRDMQRRNEIDTGHYTIVAYSLGELI